MNPAFICAILDTLLPGDGGGPAGEPPLPPASAVGIDSDALIRAHHQALDAIAAEVGGAAAFAAASEPARMAAVQAVERAMPDAFRALLSAILADYYETASVLAAMGWRAEPPQPMGHGMPTGDDVVLARLDRLRRREKLWRG
jgi:hypothetical protein